MLHRAVASRRTVDMGHERTRWLMEVVSAVIPKTDTNRDRRNVRFGPTADIVADGSTWITHPLGIVRLVDLDHLRQQPCAVQIPESGEPFFDTHYCRVVVTIECSQGDPGKSFAPNAANVHSRAKRK